MKVPVQGLAKASILAIVAVAIRYFVSLDASWYFLIGVVAYYCIKTEDEK